MSRAQSPAPAVVRVLQFTDLHLFGDREGRLLGVDTAESFRACVDLARQRHWPADLVLLTGDLTHDESPAAYARLQRLLEGLGCPVYILAGNHDERRLVQQLALEGEPLAQRRLVRGAWQFVLLDTTIPGSDGGRLAAQELAQLHDALQQAPELHTLVCMHHSPVTLHSEWLDRMRIANADALFRCLDDHPRPGGVLWGHIHQEYDEMYRGWRLLATPSTCIQFAPRSARFSIDPLPPGYRWLRLHADGHIETGVERLDAVPPGFDPDAGY